MNHLETALAAIVAASLISACSVTMQPTAPSVRAGSLSASVRKIRTGPLARPRTYDDGKTEVAEVDADVHTHVRNESGESLRFEAAQLALIWDDRGCRATTLWLSDKVVVRELTLAAGEERDFHFVCYHFPLSHERTLEGSPANGEERYVSVSGRPLISLALWSRPGVDQQVRTLLPSEEYHFVTEPVKVTDPPWSLALGVQAGAAPSLTGASYRSFVGLDLPWTLRLIELSVALAAYQDAPIALTNQVARTIAITPAVGVGANLWEGRAHIRGGWTWAPRFERDGQAHGPNVLLSLLWEASSRRVRMTSPQGSKTSIVAAQRFGLFFGWTRLYASGSAFGGKDADMLLLGVGFEQMWAPGG